MDMYLNQMVACNNIIKIMYVCVVELDGRIWSNVLQVLPQRLILKISMSTHSQKALPSHGSYSFRYNFLQNDVLMHFIALYSWGSAILACTYHGLCKASRQNDRNAVLTGCPILLQLWSYEDSYGSSQASTSVPCGATVQQPPPYHPQYEGMV